MQSASVSVSLRSKFCFVAVLRLVNRQRGTSVISISCSKCFLVTLPTSSTSEERGGRAHRLQVGENSSDVVAVQFRAGALCRPLVGTGVMRGDPRLTLWHELAP